MVCIRSNEKMILYHLNNIFEQAGESPIFFYGNSNNTIWLEYETWVEKMKKRELVSNLAYFYISSFPINPYEIYSTLKMVFQLGKGFVTDHIKFEVLICLMDNDLMEIDILQQQVKELSILFEKDFSLDISTPKCFVNFYFAYNVFGSVTYADFKQSNQIQQFINTYSYQVEPNLCIDTTIEIAGTDVIDLCKYLKKQVEITHQQNRQLGNLIPFTKPISLKSLVKNVNRGNFEFVEVVNLEQVKKNELLTSYSSHLHLQSEKHLVDQILGYIN